MTLSLMATRARTAMLVLAVAAPAAFAVPTAVSAQTAPAGLPDAKGIMAEYTKALGGRDAFDKLQSIHMVGTFEMPAMGMTGTVETFSARPNRSYTHVNIGGFGDVLNGTDGAFAWSVNPMSGATALKGAELTAALEDATFTDNLRDPAAFTSVETVDKTTIDGRVCYKVKLVRKSGRVTYDCYSVDNHLLVATIDMRATEAGDLESTTIARDYKEFGGIMMPTQLTVHVADQDQVIKINTVEINNVAANKFDPPADVKALIKK